MWFEKDCEDKKTVIYFTYFRGAFQLECSFYMQIIRYVLILNL